MAQWLTCCPDYHFLFLFLYIVGAGITNVYVASTEVISFYFDKYKTLAFAVIVIGFYVGISAWPVISQKLFDTYGYSITMAVFAIPQIIHIITGFLFIEPTLPSTDNSSELTTYKGIL